MIAVKKHCSLVQVHKSMWTDFIIDWPVDEGNINGTCDVGSGKDEYVGIASNLVQLSQQCIDHPDGIWRFRTSKCRAPSRRQALHLINEYTHQSSRVLNHLLKPLEHLLHQFSTLREGSRLHTGKSIRGNGTEYLPLKTILKRGCGCWFPPAVRKSNDVTGEWRVSVPVPCTVTSCPCLEGRATAPHDSRR